MKIVSRTLICLICLALCFTFTASAEVSNELIKVNSIVIMVNGQEAVGNNLLYNDRTYVPLRAIAEDIGCTVNWDEATSTATITSAGKIAMPEDLVSDFSDYDQAYAALEAEYDIYISYNEQLGNTEVVDELKQELANKAELLKKQFEKPREVKNVESQILPVELNAVKVVVNGTNIDAPNILYNGRTYVPFRAVFEALGCVVGWDDTTQVASIDGYFNTQSVIEEDFTSFAEESAKYIERYNRMIDEQNVLAEKAYNDTMKQSTAATGGQVGAQEQLAEKAAEPYKIRAQELQQELDNHIARLKVKYGVE